LEVSKTLLAEVRRLREENAELLQSLRIEAGKNAIFTQVKSQLTALTLDRDNLRAALEFYRSGYNGNFRCIRCYPTENPQELQEQVSSVWRYFGHTAREALTPPTASTPLKDIRED
jgi:competence protein ComGC